MVKEDAKLVEDLCKYERISFIEFGEPEYNYFVVKCMLNEEMSKILQMLIQGEDETKICDELSISQSTLTRRIRVLKRKIKRVL